MSKFYAVKIGRNPGIYNSWAECQQQVNGFKGAIFKSFKTKEEADNFINGEDNKKVASIDNLNENECVAYVDGSFKKDTGEYSFGCVLFHNGKIDKFNQKFPKSEFSTHRNVSGEVSGSVFAIKKAVELKMNKITIFYDYQGIESWANGDWKTNNNLTKSYKKFIDEIKPQIDINFVKVKGHSNDTYNDMADELAKEALGIGE